MHSQAPEPNAILRTWGLTEPSQRGPRARVGLEQIVAGALRLADDVGPEAVTLAAVAGTVGLTTTGLYRYIDTKELLGELVVDAALGPAPERLFRREGGDAHDWVDALWDRYRAHPWLAGTTIRRVPRCPNAYAWLAALVGALEVARVPRAMTTAIAIDTLTRGYAQQAQISTDTALSTPLAAEVRRRFPALDGSELRVEPRDDLHAAVDRLLTVH